MLQVKTNPEMPLAQVVSHQIEPLANADKSEVLDFLAARPLNTFVMAGFIRDNGVVSSFNRGTFYGCRNTQRQLEAVALIGHITLFEAKTDTTLEAFAYLTQTCPSAHAVLGEQNKINRFLSYYTNAGAPPRLVCRELLLEKWTAENLNNVQSLRPARAEELELIVPIHAQTAVEESGVNPLDVDPLGFRERCARRIKQGRVWVTLENGQLKFKADVVSDTPEVVYLEGVYVSAEHRGNGYGARCMTQLTNHLLERTKSVCMLVNQTNLAAQACYRKAGYEFREYYDTLYLQQPSADQELES